MNRATKFKEISKTVSLFFLLRPNYKSFSSDSCSIVFLVILSISSKNLLNFLAQEHLRFEFQNLNRYFSRPGPPVSLPSSPPLCSASPRHARVATPPNNPGTRAGHPRLSCHARPPLALTLHDDAAALSFPAAVFSFSSPSSSSWNSSRARPHRRADELRPPFLDFARPRPPHLALHLLQPPRARSRVFPAESSPRRPAAIDAAARSSVGRHRFARSS